MEIDKYKELKEEIRNNSFEKKYVSVDLILYYASFFGNAASVFFAFFLWFPSLLKTITMHVADNALTHGVAVLATVILLGMVELLKRGVVGIFSSEYIQSGRKLSDKSVKGLAMFSAGLVILSFYFSVNGAMEFSKTSGKQNVVVESTSKAAIDSLTAMWENDKKAYVAELQDLRKSNKEIREKRDNTPLEQRRTRADYNSLLHDNEKSIENNNTLIWTVDADYKIRIADIKKKEGEKKVQNQQDDSSNVILFLIVSTFIEILIVVGVYFRQVYVHKSFYEAELLLEPLIKQRERYEYLLRLVYKDGDIVAEDQIISLNKLTEIVKKKGIAYNAKSVKEFYDTFTHLGAFNLVGNKRYALVSYEDAKKLLNSLENL